MREREGMCFDLYNVFHMGVCVCVVCVCTCTCIRKFWRALRCMIDERNGTAVLMTSNKLLFKPRLSYRGGQDERGGQRIAADKSVGSAVARRHRRRRHSHSLVCVPGPRRDETEFFFCVIYLHRK